MIMSEPLSREQIDAMEQRLLESHELHPLTPGNIRRLCAMARAAAELERARGGECDHKWAVGPYCEPTRCEKCGMPASPPAQSRFCWLIERGQQEKQEPTLWWRGLDISGIPYMGQWTEMAHEAVRFSTREEAETRIQTEHLTLCRAVEHGFLPPAQDSPSFPNCKYRMCDLPGQCLSEGKCHHPRQDSAAQDHPSHKWREEDGNFGDRIHRCMQCGIHASTPLAKQPCEHAPAEPSAAGVEEPVILGTFDAGGTFDGEIEDWEVDWDNKVAEEINIAENGSGARLPIVLKRDYDKLAARLREMDDAARTWKAAWNAACEDISKLERDREALRKDAERYRFLRDGEPNVTFITTKETRGQWVADADFDLDAAIDAALSASPGARE